MSANQKDWTKLFDIAQFSYNLQRSESTGQSPFEIVMGKQLLTPKLTCHRIQGTESIHLQVCQRLERSSSGGASLPREGLQENEEMGRQEETPKRIPSGASCICQDVRPHEMRWTTSGSPSTL